ncbi:MAG: hypothetical protein PHH54_00475 [Candidatus Nanoarchaeia archaeon]|nr:hypothetical protein [Candidatus Nanoarchaeia archaeon]MDD5740438.1 hypothetical protein [Candidatus Nanoarchaeia archaeon]
MAKKEGVEDNKVKLSTIFFIIGSVILLIFITYNYTMAFPSSIGIKIGGIEISGEGFSEFNAGMIILIAFFFLAGIALRLKGK